MSEKKETKIPNEYIQKAKLTPGKLLAHLSDKVVVLTGDRMETDEMIVAIASLRKIHDHMYESLTKRLRRENPDLENEQYQVGVVDDLYNGGFGEYLDEKCDEDCADE